MKLIQLPCLLLCCALFLSISSCSSTIPNNYVFEKNSKKGVVAMTILCNIPALKQNAKLNITLLPSNNSLMHKVVIGTQCKYKSKTIAVNDLPAGRYKLAYWFATDRTIKARSQFKDEYFNVYPQQITYIGTVYMLGVHRNFYYKITNNAKTDIPLIRKRLPNLAQAKINHAHLQSK